MGGGGAGMSGEGEAGLGGSLDASSMSGGEVEIEDQWVEREYIYTPGYVHEFIAQIDRYGDPLIILQDATRNVIGLADETGAIARQYTYDPYGDLIFSEMLASHAHNRIGHKGLFFDRLNGATTDRQLIPAAHGFYHNTNRAYAPEYGRYLQTDPYGTGMPVLESMAQHGVVIDLSTSTPSFNELHADGMNRFAYLGAEPVMQRDPSGLFLSLLGPTSTAEMYLEHNINVIDTGASFKSQLDAMLTDYGWGQLHAADAIAEVRGREDGIVGYTAGGVALAARLKRGEKHHLIPRFMLGLDRKDNIYKLPKRDHDRYHAILREEFRRHGLNPMNSQGDRRWMTRLKKGHISSGEVGRVRQALIRSAREFDLVTGGRHRLASRVVASLSAGSVRGPLGLLRRRVR